MIFRSLVFCGRGKKSRWCDKSQCHFKTKKKRKEKKKRGIVILIGRNAYHTDIVNVLILNDYCHDMLAQERTKERKKERKKRQK